MGGSASVPDKLFVFVSSTIGECAEERRVAREAIQSLNHEPFLFEDSGARPYPPRELYLPKLENSHIFIAIYRHSYGWIAPGESVSGLEDEYRYALKRGMPCLIYVHSDAAARDTRLSDMVAEIQKASLITYAKYSQATDLLERIRNDVEAVVAQRFVRAEQLESVVLRDADEEITATKRGSNALVPRPEVTAQLVAVLNSVGVVQLVGDAGSGKTTLLAAISAEHGFTYIPAAYLSPLELAEVILRRLKPTPSTDLSYHVTLEGTHRELRSVCDGLSTFTLAIDGLDSAGYATELIRAIGGTSSQKRIIYSLRYSELINGHSQISVPPFERREIEALLREEGRSFDSTTLDELLSVSNGNPLLLRYCIERGAGDYSQGLREFETAQWNSLPPRSKEVVSYIAISQAMLSLDDLLLLVGSQQIGPEGLVNELRNASWFLSEDAYGFALRHEHQRETVLGVLNGSPQKRATTPGVWLGSFKSAAITSRHSTR